MIDIKVIFLTVALMVSGMVEARSVITGTNTDVASTVIKLGFKAVSPVLVTQEEKHQILIEELAMTIAAVLNHSGDWWGTLQQLGDVVYQQKLAHVMAMDEDDVNDSIKNIIDAMRSGSEQLMALLEKEVLGELTREDLRSFMLAGNREDSVDNEMLSELIANYSEVEIRDRIQGGWHYVNTILDKMTDIAAIEDTDKRRRALAEFEADFERSHFENFVGAAKVKQMEGELPRSDIESMVRSAYLDRLFTTEMAQLAQALGRRDLDKVETSSDRHMRVSKKLSAELREKERQKIGELATVLQQIAEQKQQQETD